MKINGQERPAGGNSPPSCKYEEFMQLQKDHRFTVKRDIDSIYRYLDEDGKEKFYFNQTLKGMQGQSVLVTSHVRHVGNSEEFPPTSAFEFNKKNLDAIKGDFHRKTNFYLVADDRGHASTINRQLFLEGNREKIQAAWKTVKVDLDDLTKEIATVGRSA